MSSKTRTLQESKVMAKLGYRFRPLTIGKYAATVAIFVCATFLEITDASCELDEDQRNKIFLEKELWEREPSEERRKDMKDEEKNLCILGVPEDMWDSKDELRFFVCYNKKWHYAKYAEIHAGDNDWEDGHAWMNFKLYDEEKTCWRSAIQMRITCDKKDDIIFQRRKCSDEQYIRRLKAFELQQAQKPKEVKPIAPPVDNGRGDQKEDLGGDQKENGGPNDGAAGDQKEDIESNDGAYDPSAYEQVIDIDPSEYRQEEVVIMDNQNCLAMFIFEKGSYHLLVYRHEGSTGSEYGQMFFLEEAKNREGATIDTEMFKLLESITNPHESQKWRDFMEYIDKSRIGERSKIGDIRAAMENEQKREIQSRLARFVAFYKDAGVHDPSEILDMIMQQTGAYSASLDDHKSNDP